MKYLIKFVAHYGNTPAVLALPFEGELDQVKDGFWIQDDGAITTNQSGGRYWCPAGQILGILKSKEEPSVVVA